LLIWMLTLVVASAQNPLIYLSFNEGSGTTVANTGSREGSGSFEAKDPRDNVTDVPMPEWSTNVPTGTYAPGSNKSSINFGTNEWRSIYFDVNDGLGTDGLAQFTITGWVNVTSNVTGPGGNRIISTWLGGKSTGITGVDLVVLNGTQLRIGINSAPDYPNCGVCGPYSSENVLTVDETAAASNWKFFAVTYGGGNITYYFGDGTHEAAMDALGAQQYAFAAGNPIAASLSGLSIGQFTRSAIKNHGFNRGMYGLMDEIRVYNVALDLSAIKTIQKSPLGSAIYSFDHKPKFDVFPNPVSSILTVKLLDQTLVGSKLRLSTTGGQTVCKQTLNEVNNRVNIQNLPRGIYLMTVESGFEKTHRTIAVR